MANFEINKKWCKGCGICVTLCPKQVLGIQDEKVEIVNAEACIKCHLCEYRCPDFAIFVKEEK
ncbi:MAG: 4Fe-4S binding protein [Oscillospiraceae bacterium]